MQITRLAIPEVPQIEPSVFGEVRSFFTIASTRPRFEEAVGRKVSFVQNNHSKSTNNVLRGLHCQIKQPDGKLVRVVDGSVYDVAVDLRRASLMDAQWVGDILSAENKAQLWVPEGFAHGFVVLSETAGFVYKTTDHYAHEHERYIVWKQSSLAIM